MCRTNNVLDNLFNNLREFINIGVKQMDNMKKVLVIDDSPFVLKAVKIALEPNGFNVVGHAENGKIGLALYEKFIPHIVTVDIVMPVMDGLETITQLLKRNPNVKIVVISAMGNASVIEKIKNMGIKHFIVKPFKAKQLLDVVNLMI